MATGEAEEAGRMNLLDGLRRLTARLTAGARRVRLTIRGWATGITTAAKRAAGRHRDRIADDPGYTRTVATAVSELAVTLLPQPNVATAVAILLSGILSPDEPQPHRARQTPVYDENGYDPYPSTHRSNTASAGSLWDRLGT